MEETLKKLKALLESLDGITDAAQRAEVVSSIDSADLSEFRKAAKAELQSSESLAEAEAYKAAHDLLDAEITKRETSAKEEADRLAEIKAQVADPEEEAEEDAPEEEAPETPEAEVEEAPVEAVPLAASVAAINRRIEQESRPETHLKVKAVTAGAAAGRTFSDHDTMDEVADVFHDFAGQVRSGRQSLVHLETEYPEERRLRNDMGENTRKLASLFSPRAITAAGGICEPLPADFTHPICSDRSRPIRDGLPVTQLMRGGVRFAPAATIGDLSDAITVWTEETDADPGSTVKACPHVDCEEEVEVKVDAIVRCLTVGNFQARFNPEFWASRLNLLLVEHDQAAEQNSFNQIITGSTSVDATDYTGTIQNVLIALDTAAAGLRSRHRLNRQTAIRTILPDWIDAALRSHLAAQNPGGNPDQYRAAMDDWYAVRNIRPIYSPDIEIFGSQSAGALVSYPAEITVPVFPEGTWVFGDGGTLDLGTQITDSTLNEVNDRQAFAETFEVTFKRGCESLAVDIPLGIDCICPAETVVSA